MSVIPFTGNEMPDRSSRHNLITNNLTSENFPRYRQPDPGEIRIMLTRQAQYVQPDPEDTLITLRQDMEQYLHSTDVDCMPCRGSE